MLTGDALLTSLHVAKKVNICSDKVPCATLTVVGAVDPLTSGTASTSSNASSVSASVIHVWTVYDEKTGVETTMPFDVQNEAVTKLGKSIFCIELSICGKLFEPCTSSDLVMFSEFLFSF